MIKIFEEFEYSFADAGRMDLIQDYLDNLKEDSDYNIDDPNTDELLDPYDGYDSQTYRIVVMVNYYI